MEGVSGIDDAICLGLGLKKVTSEMYDVSEFVHDAYSNSYEPFCATGRCIQQYIQQASMGEPSKTTAKAQHDSEALRRAITCTLIGGTHPSNQELRTFTQE